MKTSFVFIMSVALILSTQAQESNRLLVLRKTILLPKVEGRIDHMAFDIAGQRLFVAALGNNTVEVVDLKAGKVTPELLT